MSDCKSLLENGELQLIAILFRACLTVQVVRVIILFFAVFKSFRNYPSAFLGILRQFVRPMLFVLKPVIGGKYLGCEYCDPSRAGSSQYLRELVLFLSFSV